MSALISLLSHPGLHQHGVNKVVLSRASRQILLLFFTSVIMSVQQYCYTTWHKCLSTTLKSKLLHQMKSCSKIVGQHLEKLYESGYHNNIQRLANNIVSDPNHALNNEYKLLPSNRKIPRFNTFRLKHS